MTSQTHKLIFILLALFGTMSLSAQKTNEQMGGVYYAYHAPKRSGAVDAPDGYKPILISHYARHGSRWLANESQYKDVLAQFADKSNLTAQGKKAQKVLNKVWKDAQTNIGMLTPLGMSQHEGIACRMLSAFPEAFASGAQVEGFSSTMPRCYDSMSAFFNVLRSRNTDNHMALSERKDETDMCWIAYSSDEEERLIKSYRYDSDIDAERFTSQFFKVITRVSNPEKFMRDFYVIASDIQNTSLKVNLFDYFTDNEMRTLYEEANERMWVVNGQSPDNYGVPQRSAISLWKNIEAEADRYISQNRHGATLRFGHDSSLYRLLSLMGLSTLSDERFDDMDKAIPMAANLQIVFYSNGKNIIVQILHNEQPVKLFRESDKDGFYTWSQLKKYMRKRINRAEKLGLLQRISTINPTDTTALNIPAVLEPFGMNSWTPQNVEGEQFGVSPYRYDNTLFQGFRSSHWLNGVKAQDYGSFTLMPLMNSLRLQPLTRASRFSHEGEEGHPDYYSVVLPDEHLKAEMTGMSHSAFFRFKYQKDGRAYFVVQANSDLHEGWLKVDTVRNIVYGCNPIHRQLNAQGEKAGINGYFIVAFQDQISSWGIDTVDSVQYAWVAFDVARNEELLVKASTSFVDLKGAWNNMQEEIPHWEFYDTRCRIAESWIRRLSRIDVESSDAEAVNKFYSAIYRNSFLPRAFSDKDGRFPTFAHEDSVMVYSFGKIGGKAIYRRTYMDYPLPYTYRAQNPLNLIIEPQYGTMMQNLVDMYEQSGSIPDFPACNNEASVSDTHYATIVLADALLKGVRSIKTEKAYEAMRKSILSVPYTKGNYDNDLAAYCLAQVAKKLGKDSDYQLLLKRSANWKKAVDNLDFINNSIPDSDAWYVFSALGFYPSPASDRYVLGIPTFDKIRIGNLTIIVENALKENAGKKKVSFNGKDYPHNYITHEMIEQGGVLEFGITN